MHKDPRSCLKAELRRLEESVRFYQDALVAATEKPLSGEGSGIAESLRAERFLGKDRLVVLRHVLQERARRWRERNLGVQHVRSDQGYLAVQKLAERR